MTIDSEIWRDETRGQWQGRGISARFTFHFSDWRPPGREGFGVLRVLNEDRIEPRSGFATHAHRDLEILMIPLQGGIAHEDSLGNTDTVLAGDVLLMQAGSGIEHSQFNAYPDSVDHHLQVWIAPRKPGATPSVRKLLAPLPARLDRWVLVASADGEGHSLVLNQDARVWLSRLSVDQTLSAPSELEGSAFLHVATGSVAVKPDTEGSCSPGARRSQPTFCSCSFRLSR
jgi:quercetin 2,3-dioxygenase